MVWSAWSGPHGLVRMVRSAWSGPHGLVRMVWSLLLSLSCLLLMRLLLPGFLAFLVWSAATMALYQRWFLAGPEAARTLGSIAPEVSAKTADTDLPLKAAKLPFAQTDGQDNAGDQAGNQEFAEPASSLLPVSERLNLVSVSGAAPWLPDPASSDALENWAKKLADQPGSGVVIFCNYSPSEGQPSPTPGKSLHPAASRGNAVRTALFKQGIQPARCTLVYRQVSDDALKREGYAHLVFVADDPVPWSASMTRVLSTFAAKNPEKELSSAVSGQGGMLLTRHLRFDYGSSSLPTDPETAAFFSNFSEYLNRHPEKSVCITGHTCDISSAGFNQRLGAARAASVRQRLLELGVAPDRLQAGSAGEEQPIGENSSSPGQQANRRVELLLR